MKIKISYLALAGAIATLVSVAGGAQAATNLLSNGSFETGDFTGWTQSGNTGATDVEVSGFDGLGSEDGTYFAALGPVGSDGLLSQTFSDVAGQNYLASFYVASDGDTPNDFGVTGPGSFSLATMNDLPKSGYIYYSGSFVGSGSDTITFNFRNDPGYLALDNVSVTSLTSAAPEPTTWAMMLVGFGGLGAAMRGRRRQALATA